MDSAENPFDVFVGIDWGSEAHEVCAIGGADRRPRRKSIPHSAGGISDLVSWMRALSDEGTVAVAIEVSYGPLVEAIVDAGFDVFSINPKQVDRFRDRHSMSGAKDDRRDAYVLADALSTDLQKFRAVHVPDAITLQLREATRWHEELGGDQRRFANRLWELLQRYFPAALELCPAADEPWFWELLAVAADPAKAKLVRRGRIATILRRHRKRAITAEQVLTVVRSTPLYAAPGTIAALVMRVGSLLAQLETTHESLAICKRQIRELVAQTGRVGAVIASHPGIGILLTGVIVGEAHQAVAERDLRQLRALAGTAPVTKRSGKSDVTGMRRACNHRLRTGVRQWAFTAVRCDPYAKSLYADMRARGLGYERALRGVADRLLARLVATLRDDVLYDAQRQTASARRAEPAAA